MKQFQRARWSLLIIGLSFFFLQSCRQNLQPTASPVASISDPTVKPTSTTLVELPPPTPLPNPVTPTPAASPTAVPTPTVAALQPFGQTIIGHSLQNRPITAHWLGTGPRKIVIIGSGETAESWLTYFQNQRGPFSTYVTIWFIPDFNPDNADPSSSINANGVDLTLNADSRFANCPNQQQKTALAGPYPFSEPESQALRDFLADALVAVWMTAESATIHPGGCGQHPPSNELASTLTDHIGTPVINDSPLESGHFEDYLAGEGTATVVMNPIEPEEEIITALLTGIDQIAFANPTESLISSAWIEPENSSRWQFPAGTFVHPIALETLGSYIYILDSGQVQQLDRENPTMPETILAPGAEVAGVQVIEPLDIAASGQILYVLDRAGDVYAYDTVTSTWKLSRYDRPVGETSSHYYMALAAQSDQQFLLEGSYHIALTQAVERPDFIWPLPEYHQIDLAVNQNQVYILSQSPYSQTATLNHYENGAKDTTFSPGFTLQRPRQIAAFDSELYVLDQAGRRLLTLNALTGQPQTIYQPADGAAWTAFNINQLSGQLLLAAKDSLTFFNGPNDPGKLTIIQGTGFHPAPQINDPQVLQTLRGLLMPIGGSDIALRENQMPGAPRHYRLGVHEGADFYWQSGTPVRAVAAGTVIRALTDYEIPSQELFNFWQSAVQVLGYTSSEAHDFYRGRQVWIEHEGGIVSRYVHLSAIDDMIQEGITVQAGQIIGAVGNTGSPVSLDGPDTDAHLHFELWLNDHYLGQFLRPIETREWLKIILNE